MKILIFLLSLANFNCNTHPPAAAVSDRNDTNHQKNAIPIDTMEVKNNSEFNIQLRASLGTGNKWMLEDSLDKNYLILIRTTTVTDSTEMAAKPDLQTFVFKTLQKGSSTISFIYKRPWIKKTEAKAERKKYIITII